MALFRRKKAQPDENGADANGNGKKEKGSWRRPASESLVVKDGGLGVLTAVVVVTVLGHR